MSKKLEFEIEVNDNGTAKVRKFKRAVEDTERNGTKFGRSMGGISRKLSSFTLNAGSAAIKVGALGVAVATAAGAFAAWKIKQLASSFIETGSSMDKLKLSLDTITKGEGEAWFKRLNEWALKMPINTAKAIESFTMMRAMGLKPSIADMTTLVDTTSALGGGSEKLMGIARALGQIKTKGKVSAEELNQLAEQGVNAQDILREKLGLTAQELTNIGTAGISADKAVNALMEGMEERYGGQSSKLSEMWSGMVESLKSYWTEFKRLVMESGVMEYLEKNIRAVRDWVDDLHKSGKMKEWAANVAESVINLGEDIYDFILDSIEDWGSFQDKIEEVFSTLKRWINETSPVLKTFWNLIKGVAKTLSMMGSALDAVGVTGMISHAGDIANSGGTQSYASGTGPSGLPHTGLFLGHKGEIVKNPAESEQERRGSGGGGPTINVYNQPRYQTGDANAGRNVAADIKRLLGDLNIRWGEA
jgi:tape measure domain-containing protein